MLAKSMNAVWVLVAIPMSGCATIMNGTTQEVRFRSTPVAADVRAGSLSTTTPGSLHLERAKEHDVEITKPGFLPARVHIGQVENGAMDGNLIMGGLIGMTIDLSTGAHYDLEPCEVDVTLVPEENPTTPAE
jgi:hypothetical protein